MLVQVIKDDATGRQNRGRPIPERSDAWERGVMQSLHRQPAIVEPMGNKDMRNAADAGDAAAAVGVLNGIHSLTLQAGFDENDQCMKFPFGTLPYGTVDVAETIHADD